MIYNLGELEELLNIKRSILVAMCNRGRFPNAFQEKRKWYIPHEDYLMVKEEVDFINNSYTLNEAAEKLHLKPGTLKQKHQEYFETVRKIELTFYVTKAEVHKLLEANKEYFEMESPLGTKEVAELLNYKRFSNVLLLLKEGCFPNARQPVGLGRAWRIPLSDVETYLEEKKNEEDNEYMTAKRAKQFLDCKRETIDLLIEEGKIKGAFIRDNGHWAIPISELERVKKEREEHSERNELERFLYKFENEEITEYLSETVSIYKEYCIQNYYNKRYRKKSVLLNMMFLTLLELKKHLKKELYLHDDTEIIHVLSIKDFSISKKRILIPFINHLKVIKNDRTLYKENYVLSANDNNRVQKEIYSRKIFFSYYKYIQNIENHIENAVSSRLYAEIWFYVSMHFVNAWRSSDIANFPSIVNLDIVGIYNFDWFKERRLDIITAQKLINSIIDQSELFHISKTGGLNKFFVNQNMVETIATSLVILELHRRNEGNDVLLQRLHKWNPRKEHYEKFFKEHKDLYSFSSLKANRSFLTYFFDSVNKGENNTSISNLLTTKMRGHHNEDSIEHYIMETNKDGTIEDVSYHLFRRGHFGWLYSTLVELVTSQTEETLNLEEKTILIEKYQDFYTPQEVEELTGFLLKYQEQKMSIAMELALLPKEKLIEKLDKINKGQMSSKEEHGQCIVSGNCKFPNGSCFSCPYLVPRTYLLFSIKDEIQELIDEFNEIDDYKKTERMKKTFLLFKLMDLLNQASVSIGREYINSFIDLKEVKEKLHCIQHKLLR